MTRHAVCGAAMLGLITLPAPVHAAATATGRGYEQVTPAIKDFGFGQSSLEIAISAPAGGAAAYNTFGPLPGSAAGTFENFYVGRRSDDAWGTTPISPPQEPIPGGTNYPVTQGFSPDLSHAIVKSANPTLTPDAVPDVTSMYLRDNATGAYRLLTPGPASPSLSPFVTLGGASADFTRVVFEAQDQLVPDAPASGNLGVYEWSDGHLRNVGVLPDGTPAPAAILGAGAQALNRVQHAVSRDGRRIVFWSDGQLYVRTDGSSTTRVSASQRTSPDPNGPREALFWGATADGGQVFFTSSEALTDDANTGTDGSGTPTAAGNDLYRYDVASGALTDLSVDLDPADSATGAAVQGMVAASDDGAYVYFVALGNLAGGATVGAPNLYVRHAGATTYIATLDFADAQVWGLVQSGASGLTSRLTPDGRTLVLQSMAPLTGYDNVGPSTGTAYSEVFRYTADTGELRCLSCRGDGTPPAGGSTITPPDFATNTPRNVSDDGRRVFFDSADDIVRADTNGRRDVYEYADGALQLLSTGTARLDASFQDASASGADVLFSTAAQLVPQDVDGHVDLYDARIGGGFPAKPPTAPPCRGDACQGPATPAPAIPVAASVTFTGPGNGPPAPVPLRVTVSKAKTVRGVKATMKVKVPAAGALTVSGSGLRTARRRLAKAQTVNVSMVLTQRARATLKRRHRLKVTARVAFKPTGGASSAASVSLTFKQPNTKGRS
ncbi:MAG TPA: hypothetical protein VGO71_20395 [Baekduia sp.]|nr:hypothetical protein [Baekduia sp.]